MLKYQKGESPLLGCPKARRLHTVQANNFPHVDNRTTTRVEQVSPLLMVSADPRYCNGQVVPVKCGGEQGQGMKTWEVLCVFLLFVGAR